MNKKLVYILAVTTIISITSTGINEKIALAAEDETIQYIGYDKDDITNGGGTGDKNENEDKPDPPSLPSSNIQSKKVIIKSVSIDKTTIEPGQDFSLTYNIENISGKKIYDLSLKIVGVEGKGTLDGFTPIGTTNEIYVGFLPVKGNKDITIKLTSDPNMKTGVYNFLTSVMFNEYEKEQEEISKLSGIVLKSNPQVNLAEVSCNDNGNGSSIVGTIINEGKTKVKNVIVKAKVGDKDYTFNVGNIDIESDDTFEIFLDEVTADSTAEVEVIYEDEMGNSYSTKGNCAVRKTAYNDIENGNNIDDSQNRGGFWGFIKNIFKFGA